MFRLLLEASAGNLPRVFSGILYKFMTSFFFFFFLLWFVMDDPALRLIFLEVPCTHFSKIKLVQNALHTFSCSAAFCGKQIWSNRKDSSEHTGGSFKHSFWSFALVPRGLFKPAKASITCLSHKVD